MDRVQHRQSTDYSHQTLGDALSKPESLDWPSLHHEGLAASLSPATQPKALKSPLVSTDQLPETECPDEATGSSVRPNTQNNFTSIGVSATVNQMYARSRSQPRRM